ncbi:MAG: helix-turn-helix transcriptional regulator [Cyclobacteriaceae bacterium]|nr:helix-turn-helix transcriptional regulator [Cyclobacteriaceae bacterium]
MNAFRIEFAKELLFSPDFNKFTIDVIAVKSGFNSKSPFYAAFKKYTGFTPKQ